MSKLYIPLRFKILLALLFVVLTVVGAITLSMAKMFHTDKTNYVHDLTSVMALNVAQEAQSLLVGYEERLQVFAQIMVDPELTQKQKRAMLEKLFQEFRVFVAVTIYPEKREPVTVYNAGALTQAKLTETRLHDYRRDKPLPLDEIRKGRLFVENSTVTAELPSVTLAVAHTTEGVGQFIVSGVIRLDELLRLAGRSKVFETFIVDSRGALLSHSDVTQVIQRITVDWLPDLHGVRQGLSVGTTREYTHNDVEMVGGFAALDRVDLLAGVQIPKQAAYLTARNLLVNLAGVALALLLLSTALSLFWSRRLTRPLEKLSDAAGVVAKGEFDIHVDAPWKDEIGELAGSFNHMIGELKERETALMQAQAALIQSEKMAAFGQLGAGVAHEVKNPLTGILGYAQLAQRKLEADHPLQKNLSKIEKETLRCKEIIENLLKFARQEKADLCPIDINEVVESAISIVDHPLTINGVSIEKDLAQDIPSVLGNANQLQQVIMNFMINSQQAMEGKPGMVRVSTRKMDDRAEIRVFDNGPGIPKELQSKIFEPFFTTKPAGQGTGLGLSVTYGIIKDHNGNIDIISEPGEGTTFIITIPLAKT